MHAPRVPSSDEAAWLHSMRNELNTATMSLAVLNQLIGTGLSAEPRQYLERAEAACRRCGALMESPPGGHAAD